MDVDVVVAVGAALMVVVVVTFQIDRVLLSQGLHSSTGNRITGRECSSNRCVSRRIFFDEKGRRCCCCGSDTRRLGGNSGPALLSKAATVPSRGRSIRGDVGAFMFTSSVDNMMRRRRVSS